VRVSVDRDKLLVDRRTVRDLHRQVAKKRVEGKNNGDRQISYEVTPFGSGY
jgi:hypothetical protein